MFAIKRVGFEYSRSDQQNAWVSFSFQESKGLSSRSDSFIAAMTCSFLTPIPCMTSSTAAGTPYPGVFESFEILGRFEVKSLVYQSTSSSSTSAKSASGSPVPGSEIFPSLSTLPEASTTCSRASDWAATLRNWFPSPLPIQAPLIRPGKSVSSTGMNLHPSSHFELAGLSVTPNSLWTQSVTTLATPVSGAFVVKG